MSNSTVRVPPPSRWKRLQCRLFGHRWASQQYVYTTWNEYRRCRSCGRIEQ